MQPERDRDGILLLNESATSWKASLKDILTKSFSSSNGDEMKSYRRKSRLNYYCNVYKSSGSILIDKVGRNAGNCKSISYGITLTTILKRTILSF